jgi:hypothetical protein
MEIYNKLPIDLKEKIDKIILNGQNKILQNMIHNNSTIIMLYHMCNKKIYTIPRDIRDTCDCSMCEAGEWTSCSNKSPEILEYRSYYWFWRNFWWVFREDWWMNN